MAGQWQRHLCFYISSEQGSCLESRSALSLPITAALPFGRSESIEPFPKLGSSRNTRCPYPLLVELQHVFHVAMFRGGRDLDPNGANEILVVSHPMLSDDRVCDRNDSSKVSYLQEEPLTMYGACPHNFVCLGKLQEPGSD